MRNSVAATKGFSLRSEFFPPTTHTMRFPPLRTGGALNSIHERVLNDWRKTTRTVHLIDKHRPTTATELCDLYASHSDVGGDVCVLCQQRVVGGGLSGWTATMHAAVVDERRRATPANATELMRVTMQSCADFVYDLYVRAPMRGHAMEVKALADIDAALGLVGRHAGPHEDSKYAIDLVYDGEFAVQVKPVSFRHRAVHDHDMYLSALRRNVRWGVPVVWLYYDGYGEWSNLEEVVTSARRVLDGLPMCNDVCRVGRRATANFVCVYDDGNENADDDFCVDAACVAAS
jgi:hypothetical protein